MFGSDRFAFETPNVIDPGDLPPSRPRRAETTSSCHSNTASTNSGSEDSSTDDNDDYQEARDSSARLLRDIGDLDLSPKDSSSLHVPYDPYDEEEGMEANANNHSLPSPDEARMYATSLLGHRADKPADMEPLRRTIKLSAPSKRRYWPRGKCRYYFIRAVVVVAALGVSIGIGVAITSGVKKHDSTNEASAKFTVRHREIVKFLTENDITSMEDLQTEGSPQAVASNWMAAFDLLQLDVPSVLHASSEFVQRYALATFFFATGGSEWDEGLKFMSAQHECGWFEQQEMLDHVRTEVSVGVTCDDELQVRNLFVPNNNLKGSLPSEMRLLTHLDLLALPHNQIEGRLPEDLGTLSRLDYLDLKYNRVSGFLPEWIGDLDQLTVLGLSNNEFAGPVPANYGTLAKLKTLGLDENALTGSIDFASHLKNLEYFWADRNLLEGTIDDNFLRDLTHLRQLDLSFNALKGGDIPLHLLQHPTLRVLDLSHTDCNGQLPEIPETNPVLRFLSLRGVGLTRSIPNSFKNLKGLQHLDLYGNHLTGAIPNDMGEMISLTYLFLGSNDFAQTWEFPPLFSQLVKLRELSLTDTHIGGRIPAWLSYLSELKLLDLSNNFLGGPIPQEVWDLPKLSYLILNDNALTGGIPSTVQGVDEFEMIALHHNTGLSGSVDYFCQQNPDIEMIATDCGRVTCGDGCCECCTETDNDCFEGKVTTYLSWFEGLWEYNYTRPAYSYDPAILEKNGVVKVVSPESVP